MPIPLKTMPLSELPAGEHACVMALGLGRGISARLTTLGFTPGAELTMIQNYGHGPLVVTIRDTRIALGRREAQSILIQRIPNDHLL
jgi:ferrous iron transport protein A